jgi:hypothetical protein
MNKIESSKAWFVLANLFMMLSGFVFAAGSISFTGSLQGLDSVSNLLFRTQDICLNNLTKDNCDNMINLTTSVGRVHYKQSELWPVLLNLAIVLAFLSFLSWLKGKFNLWRLARNEN